MKQINRNTFAAIILAVAFMAFSSVSSSAATFVVNTTTDTQDAAAGDGNCADAGGACSLRAAITEANAFAGADIITLPAGTYTETLAGASENVNASGDFDITSDLTINGAGSGTTIVEANVAPGVATERVFHIRFTVSTIVVINDVTVRHGRNAINAFGGGIRVDVGAADVTLNRCVVTANQNASSGGGIAVSGATAARLTVNDSTISNNTAGSAIAGTSAIGGGIMGNVTTATINITNSTITGNTALSGLTAVGGSGGGLSSIGTTTVTNSTISNNTASVTFAASTASAFGGGVIVTAGTTTFTGSTISGNLSMATGGTGFGFAGGVYNQQATVNVTNSTVTGNTVSHFHAGIRALSQTLATTTNITNSTVSNNTANGTEGGGLVNFAVGAFNGTMNITGSTVSGNTVLGAAGLGGGLENVASAAIVGLAVINVTNSTISGNTSPNSAGSYNGGTTATINYNFATVASNTATTNGGGVFQDATGVTNLKNSIVADNAATTGPDIFGTITSQDYNHVEDVTGGTFFVDSGNGRKKSISEGFFALPNDVTGSDPALGLLQNNGGPTRTHLAGGPVTNLIPAGTNDCGTVVVVDQRGAVRPNVACEKGAVELAPVAAGASVSGRVTTAGGNGIRNAVMSITGGGLTAPLYVRTGSFGYFTFEDLLVGETYVLTVNSKRYVFSTPSRIISLTDSITDADFTAEEPASGLAPANLKR